MYFVTDHFDISVVLQSVKTAVDLFERVTCTSINQIFLYTRVILKIMRVVEYLVNHDT